MSLTHILLISGSGEGAGKTTLARKLTPHVVSLASAVRTELRLRYPEVDWEDRTPAGKAVFIEKGALAGHTVREVLLRHAEGRRAKAPLYWVDRTVARLRLMSEGVVQVVAVDDLRRILELETIRNEFPGQVTHLHIEYAGAVAEPHFEAEALARLADYVVVRK